MKVKVINKSNYNLPEYATSGSAGFDFKANIEAPETLKPLERKLIPTGLYMAIPEGHELQVRPRSGLAIKHGITVLNAPGTVDCDYRQEICVILVNLSSEEFTINPGDRIAQGVFAKFESAEWEETDTLDETSRTGGFGSTGN